MSCIQFTITNQAGKLYEDVTADAKEENVNETLPVKNNEVKIDQDENKCIENEPKKIENSFQFCSEQLYDSPSKKGAPKRKARPPRQSVHSLSDKSNALKKKERARKVKDKVKKLKGKHYHRFKYVFKNKR